LNQVEMILLIFMNLLSDVCIVSNLITLAKNVL
jgi:hypothetical protein